MKYAISIFPSKKLQDIANSYRKRFDKKYSLIPPHITLKKTFDASEDGDFCHCELCKTSCSSS